MFLVYKYSKGALRVVKMDLGRGRILFVYFNSHLINVYLTTL